MAEAVDIFTTIHRAVWQALRDWTPFTDLVAVRNQVDMTADDFSEFPPNAQEDATPEVAVVQAQFAQEVFTTGSAGVNRQMGLAVIVTTGKLNPVTLNKVKDAMLDALLAKGLTLGVPTPTNGNTVLGWSVAGDDFLTPEGSLQAPDRQPPVLRSQTIGRVTVFFNKAIPRMKR